MAQQSLYRRYRPRRFADVRGQEHVIGALRHAVAGGTEGHAYLFSGPRGTGKTSTARILAKALNCEHLVDGEPCGECESCTSIEHGTSYDLFELDAASNNGVDAMRDLISRTVVGSPGRTKVYILDEVHMLSPAASNALLKTLEEPPDHVCFVLATTDPQKVLPTIRSRTQHFEFSLLSAGELEDYVRWIIADASLAVDDEGVAYVVRQGRGSARDTLSALDMVVAAGGVTERSESVEAILSAIGDKDTAGAMAAVADAVAQGREPRVLAEHLVGQLRDAFLVAVGAPVEHLADADRDALSELAARSGLATLTKALESIGLALVDMRQAADPRVPLEVALIRLTAPSADLSLAALAQRVEELERRLASGGPAPAPAPATAPSAATPSTVASPGAAVAAPGPAGASSPAAAGSPTPPEPGASAGHRVDEPPSGAASSPAAIRAQLAANRGGGRAATPAPSPSPQAAAPPPASPPPPLPGRTAPVPPAAAAPPAEPVTTPARSAPAESAAPEPVAVEPAPTTQPLDAAGARVISLDEMSAVMTERVVPTLTGIAKNLIGSGRFVAHDPDGRFHFELDGVPERLLDRALGVQGAIEQSLSEHTGTPVSLRITIGAATGGSAPAPRSGGAAAAAPADQPAAAVTPTPAEDDEHIDLDELTDASDVSVSGVDRLVEAFPGAQIVEKES